MRRKELRNPLEKVKIEVERAVVEPEKKVVDSGENETEVVSWGMRGRKAKCIVNINHELNYIQWKRNDIPDLVIYEVENGMTDVDEMVIENHNKKGRYQIKKVDYEVLKGMMVSNANLSNLDLAELSGFSASVVNKIVPRIKEAILIQQSAPPI